MVPDAPPGLSAANQRTKHMLYDGWDERRTAAADGLARRAPAAGPCAAVHPPMAGGREGLMAIRTCLHPARVPPSITRTRTKGHRAANA